MKVEFQKQLYGLVSENMERYICVH